MASHFPWEQIDSHVELVDGLTQFPIKYLPHCYCTAHLDWIFGAFWFGMLQTIQSNMSL